MKQGRKKTETDIYLRQVEVASPAKLNLFFEIHGRRDDGYHEIETVMQAVSICDRIMLFESDNGIEITSDADWLPLDKGNFAFQAAELYFQRSGISKGVKIHIEKCIPAGAGLGGGSSNAAAVLKGLYSLFGKLSMEDLYAIAAEIGSDMAFFIDGGTAVCRGRGEITEPVEIPGSFRYVVAVPPVHVSTRDIYNEFRIRGEYPDHPESPRKVIDSLVSGDTEHLSGYIFNRLQNTALSLISELVVYKEKLDSIGGDMYFLTGSGSAFYRPVKSEDEGLRELDRFKGDSVLGKCSMFYCQQF